MPRSSFSINSTSQDFSISVDQISATGGVDSPTLVIPVQFNFHSLNRGSKNEPGTFKLISIKAELTITDKKFKCGETTQLYSNTIYDQTVCGFAFPFLLNSEIVSRIEKYRKENLPASLSIVIQVGVYSYFNALGGADNDRAYISGFETGTGSVGFEIEQSQWINKVLPQLGHNSYKLIELPLFIEIIPEEYKVSLGEFEEARKYFIKGDYDKTVAHCRAAIDPFYSNKDKFFALKEFVKSKSEFEWATKVLVSTEEWLDKIIKATSAFTSKTHHAPSVGHFSRTEAEIVLTITTGIIAYIGKIEYKMD